MGNSKRQMANGKIIREFKKQIEALLIIILSIVLIAESVMAFNRENE